MDEHDGLRSVTENSFNGAAGPEDWLVGGGEMGDSIRSLDWSSTPLGSLNSWPDSLRTTVSLCLASNFPINIVWGPNSTRSTTTGIE